MQKRAHLSGNRLEKERIESMDLGNEYRESVRGMESLLGRQCLTAAQKRKEEENINSLYE